MEQQFTQYDWALNRAAVLSWEEQEEQLIDEIDNTAEGGRRV